MFLSQHFFLDMNFEESVMKIGGVMPKPSEREIEESYDRVYGLPDEEDEALVRHVLLDDKPRQGLHQYGDKTLEE